MILTRYARDEERVVPVEAHHYMVKLKEGVGMISQENNNVHFYWTEEETSLSPAEEQQEPIVVEEKRPWLKLLIRVAGIALPLVCIFAGMWVYFVFMTPSQQDALMQQAVGSSLVLLGMLLLGVVSALLFRSWWAMLVIPIAFLAGVLLVYYLMPLVIAPNPLDIGDTGFGVLLWAIIGSIITTIGALFGTVIPKVLEVVRRH